MATNKNKQLMSGEEVQQTVQERALNQGGAANGYAQVTPVGDAAQTPTSSAWRNVQQTGNAKTDYKAILGAQPGAYQGNYQQQIGQTMNNLLGQRQFQYDPNNDPLYQQIKDGYIKQGRQAMMATQGQCAALTGGYGNSFGVMAGQQAYQESLGQLANRIPELYQLAYNRYKDDETSQRNNLAALQGLDESEYSRYQNDVQQYESKLNDLYAKYKASLGGGGRKRTDPRTDAEWFVNYSEFTGDDVDNSIDAVSKEMGWTNEYTNAVKTIVYDYTVPRSNAAQQAAYEDNHDEIMQNRTK